MDSITVKQGMGLLKSIIDMQAEQAVDVEFTLPDYCPKIGKILRCTLSPRIANVSYSGSQITIDGEGCVSVLYCGAENGELFGYETEIQFSKPVETGKDCDRLIITATAHPEYINCRAVNERKLDIHGAVGFKLRGIENCREDVVTGVENDGIQLKKETVENLEMCGYASKQFTVEDEISLSQTAQSIENIIKTGGEVIVDDCKFAASKAIVRGRLTVNVLYRTKSGCEQLSGEMPFEQIVDVDGASDDCIKKAEAMLCALKIRPFTDNDGECRSIQVSAKINIDVTAMKSVDYAPVVDCYSITDNLEVDRENITLKCSADSLNASHTLREMLDFGENSVGQVIDAECECGAPTISQDGGTLTVNGTLIAAVTLQSADSKVNCYEKRLPFSHEFAVNDCTGTECEIKTTVDSCSYSIRSSSSIELRAQISISGTVFCCKNMLAVTDINISEQKKQAVDMPAMILYFAKAGDSVWKIAMHYNTSAELIMNANGISDDVIASDSVLLIPSV